MGLPQQPSPSASAPAASTQSDPMPTNTSNNASSAADDQAPPVVQGLPPAAIDLATKLFDYARQGATAELSTYTSAGIPLNLTNHKGDTLLMLAAYHGHAQTVQMLMDKGADVDALNDRGQSPLAGAVFKGHDEVVKVLAQGTGTEGGNGKKADLYAGQPNAVDAARMFKKEEYLRLFGVEE